MNWVQEQIVILFIVYVNEIASISFYDAVCDFFFLGHVSGVLKSKATCGKDNLKTSRIYK